MFSILDPWFHGSQHDLSATQRVEWPANQTEEIMKKLLGTMAIGAMLCCSCAEKAAAQQAPSHTLFLKFQELKWEKTPDGLQDIVILHVNPVSKVTELMIRAPKNFHVPRHWHSANETLTIISGRFTMKHDGSEEKVALTPGSYSYMPAKMVHEAWTGDEGAMFFITVDGEWDLNWAK
jgi:quercetin dioxygenase-like cupin family protein